MKFLHTADLHIDSPLTGLSDYPGAPVARLRAATRDAFTNLVTLAIEEEVAFVIIAGDLFDGRWRDSQTGLWTAEQFRRLEEQGIDVYLLRGNHDSESEVAQSLPQMENVHHFPTDKPATFHLTHLNVALHGQGFAKRAIPEDLAANYPSAVSGCLNIGVLHTSLTGDPQHSTYAPTTPDALAMHGYDYWALGHVHQRRIVNESPHIVFCGNAQGRHIKETGAKGCYIVSATDDRIEEVTFHAIDVLRWALVTIELSDDVDDVLSLCDLVEVELTQLRETADGRYLAVRIILTGSTPLHGELMSTQGFEDIVNQMRLLVNGLGDVWVETVEARTTPPLDVEALRQSSDLTGSLLREFEQLRTGPNTERTALIAELEPVRKQAARHLEQMEIDFDDPALIVDWLEQSERLVLSLLAETHDDDN